MAVAIVTTPTVASDGTSGTTIAATRTMTAGNSLYVVVSFDISTAQTLSGVSGTVEGAHTVLSTSARDTTNNQGLAHSYKTNHAGGSTTVTATFSATAGARSIALIELSGTSGAPVGHNASFQSAPAAGADVVTSGTFTPTAQPGLLIGVGGNTSIQSPPSAGTGFTDGGTLMDLGLGGGDFFRLESKTVSSTASTAATFTRVTANGHCTVAAMFVVPGAGAVSNIPNPRRRAVIYPAAITPPGFPRLGRGILAPAPVTVNAYTLALATGSYALTGNDVGFAAQHTLPLTTGSYALTGIDVGLSVNRPSASMPAPRPMVRSLGLSTPLIAPDFPILGRGILAPSAAAANAYTLALSTGAYTLTGNAVGLTAQHTLPLTTGSYTLTGRAVGLNRGLYLTLSAAAFTLTGNAVGLTAQRRLALATGTFTLSGNSVTLTGPAGSFTLVASGGSFALTGNAVGLTSQRRVALATGTFTLSSTGVGLNRGYSLSLTTGSYTLTGKAVALTTQRRLALATGDHVLTGYAVGLSSPQHVIAVAGGSMASRGASELATPSASKE